MEQKCEKKLMIKNYILENFLFTDDSDELSNDQSLFDTGIIDSFGVVELIKFLETQFKIKILTKEISPVNLGSINKIESFIQNKENSK